jgi:glucose-6-phosphate isomerase, archaeal
MLETIAKNPTESLTMIPARTVADLKGIFRDEASRSALPQSTIAYSVQSFFPVTEGTNGGLFWGSTFIEPGMIGDEYYMTKGHFHAVIDRTEIYMGVAGEGALILMDQNGKTWCERMHSGSVHCIPGRVAHRVANIGSEKLSFVACWPADAGHDYETIAKDGFTARLRNVNGAPQLIEDNH